MSVVGGRSFPLGVPGMLSAPADGVGELALEEFAESGLQGSGGRIGHGGHSGGTCERKTACVPPWGMHGIAFAGVIVIGLMRFAEFSSDATLGLISEAVVRRLVKAFG